MKVFLQDVIDAISSADNEYSFFYYIPDGTIFSYSESEGILSENPFLLKKGLEEIEKDSIPLPTMQERNDYEIMKDYIAQVEDATFKDWLTNSIKGKGAFRMFRATLARFNKEKEYYDFRDEAYEEIAIDWCNTYGIEFEDSPIFYDEKVVTEEKKELPLSEPTSSIFSINEIHQHNLFTITFLANAFQKEIYHRDALEEIQEKLESCLKKENFLFSMTKNGKAIGYAILLKEGNAYLLKEIYIKKEERNKGQGTALFKYAEQVASSSHSSLILRITKEEETFKKFSEKNGYTFVEYTQIRKG